MSYTSIFRVDNFTDTEMIWINKKFSNILSNLSVVKITNVQVSLILANDFDCYILLL